MSRFIESIPSRVEAVVPTQSKNFWTWESLDESYRKLFADIMAYGLRDAFPNRAIFDVIHRNRTSVYTFRETPVRCHDAHLGDLYFSFRVFFFVLCFFLSFLCSSYLVV